MNKRVYLRKKCILVFVTIIVLAVSGTVSGAYGFSKSDEKTALDLIKKFGTIFYPHMVAYDLNVAQVLESRACCTPEQFRDSVKVEILEIKIIEVGKKKNDVVPLNVNIKARINKPPTDCDACVGPPPQGVFSRNIIFYYGETEFGKPKIQDKLGNIVKSTK